MALRKAADRELLGRARGKSKRQYCEILWYGLLCSNVQVRPDCSISGQKIIQTARDIVSKVKTKNGWVSIDVASIYSQPSFFFRPRFTVPRTP
jgi:hypothetical protein